MGQSGENLQNHLSVLKESSLWCLLDQLSLFTDEELDPKKSSYSARATGNGTVKEKTPLLSPNSYMFHPVDWKKRSLLRTIWRKNIGSKSARFMVFSPNKTPLTHEPLVPQKSSFSPNRPSTLLHCTLPFPDAPAALTHWWSRSWDESEATELTHKAAPLPAALLAFHASASGSPSFPRPMKTRGWEMKLTPEAPHKFEINAHLNVYKNNLMLTSQEQLNSHTAHTQWYFVWGVGELASLLGCRVEPPNAESTQSHPSTQDVVFLLYKDPTQLPCPLWNISSFLSHFLCTLREHAALDL